MGPGFRQDDIESVATASFNFKQPNGAGAIAPAPPVLILGSIVMVVMVVMMMMMPVGHPDDDARPISVMMVMVGGDGDIARAGCFRPSTPQAAARRAPAAARSHSRSAATGRHRNWPVTRQSGLALARPAQHPSFRALPPLPKVRLSSFPKYPPMPIAPRANFQFQEWFQREAADSVASFVAPAECAIAHEVGAHNHRRLLWAGQRPQPHTTQTFVVMDPGSRSRCSLTRDDTEIAAASRFNFQRTRHTPRTLMPSARFGPPGKKT